MAVNGRQVLAYDRTAGVLSASWAAGCAMYRATKRIDEAGAVATWGGLVARLESWAESADLDEVQVWSHGSPGHLVVGDDWVGTRTLEEWGDRLEGIGRRIRPGGIVWLRSCGTFAGEDGHRFAALLQRLLGCRVAGHTYEIGAPWQSGLRTLDDGETPDWDVREGLSARGRLLPSGPTAPRTVFFLARDFPASW